MKNIGVFCFAGKMIVANENTNILEGTCCFYVEKRYWKKYIKN